MHVQHITLNKAIHWKAILFSAMCVVVFSVFVSIGPDRLVKFANGIIAWIIDMVNHGEGYRFADSKYKNAAILVYPSGNNVQNAVSGSLTKSSSFVAVPDVLAINQEVERLLGSVAGTAPVYPASGVDRDETLFSSIPGSSVQKIRQLISEGSTDEVISGMKSQPELAYLVQQAKDSGFTKDSLPGLISSYQSILSSEGILE